MATLDLTKYGIIGSTVIAHNPSYEFLFEEETKAELKKLGFSMPDGKGNFVFAKHESAPAKEIYLALRARNIFVRFFDTPGINDRLRITVGTDEEVDKLIEALKDILEGA